MAQKKTQIKKTAKKEVANGRAYIAASFNNTLITLTDDKGATLAWGSSGASGFKGTRKSTPYAATTAVENTVKEAVTKYGLKEVDIFIKGPGPGRDSSLRAIRAAGLKISSITDVTPIPHNGPRSKKKRRV